MIQHTQLDPPQDAPVAAGEAPAADRRGARRLRTLKQGKIVLSDWTVMDCLIRDISIEGARIALGGLTELPGQFRLLVVSSNQLIPAELEWQRGLLAGIRLTGPGVQAPPRKW